MSKIEWTGKTWNPIAGCSLVSPGCTNCYAMRMAARLELMGQAKYAGTTRKVNRLAVWTGKINLDELALTIPLGVKKPTTWFVNSMSDLFHPDVPFDFVDKVFAVMALTPQHTYQILTKRPERMAEYLDHQGTKFQVHFAAKSQRTSHDSTTWPLANVWLGTSVEDQKRKTRIEVLRDVPAAVRFLSLEPLLEDLGDLNLDDIGWVIVGGESGSGARPCDVAWIRSVVEQCRAAAVPVFVKQLGRKPYGMGTGADLDRWANFDHPNDKGGEPEAWPADLRVREMPHPTVTA